ncbi:XRE family transcriptional regulator [Prevotella melaninogenica]
MENKNIVMRIKILIEHEKVSPSKFAKMIDFNQSNLSKILNGDRNVAPKLISAICDNLNVSYKWIVNGEGPMFLTNSDNNVPIVADTTSADNVPTISYSHGKPYYNVDFLGGFDIIINDQTVNPEYLIDFKKYEDADCWCNISGQSMEPLISNGDIIALKQLHDWREFLLYGEVYGIVTNDMRTVKLVTRSPKGDNYLHLVPVNKSEEYQPQDIPKKLITHVFQVLGCMKKL